MLLLDITVVSVALPSIQRDLRASLPDLQWVSAAYALVLAVLLLPAATLGDRLGRRRLFLVGLVIFTAGSLACALAPTALALELFRALQGVGGAVLFATGTPLLRAEFSGAALARAHPVSNQRLLDRRRAPFGPVLTRLAGGECAKAWRTRSKRPRTGESQLNGHLSPGPARSSQSPRSAANSLGRSCMSAWPASS